MEAGGVFKWLENWNDIGLLRTERLNEQKKSSPNQEKIQTLKKQQNAIIDERDTMLLDNDELIDKAIYVYAPTVKAIIFSRKWGMRSMLKKTRN